MDAWLINGIPGTSIAADDRGLHYGDGLFETLAVRQGECRFLDAHLERLATGCVRLGISCPDATLLEKEIAELIAGQGDGTLKIMVTRGSGPRGYLPPANPAPVRMLGFSSSAPVAYPEEGIRARYCETRIGLTPALAGLKTLNRLEQVLARAELRAEDYAEGLMLDAHEHVVCGTMSNLFVVTGEKLITPDLADAGVNGIMRAQVINVAESAGIDISIQALKQAEIAAAEGLFVTNSLIGMWPVAELDGVRFAPDAACIATIRKGLAEIGVTECVA